MFLHPSDELYGADRSLIALVRAVTDIAEPVVVLPNDLPYQGALSQLLHAEGIDVLVGPLPVIRRRYLQPASILGWLARTVTGLWWLYRQARSHQAVGIVSNTTGVVGGSLVAGALRKPHIWYIREFIQRPGWFRGYVRLAARSASGQVVAVSEAVAGWLGDIPGRGPVVGHNGVDLPELVTELPERPTATFIGRVNAWKGHEVFVAAAVLAHERVPEARFRIVGGTVAGDLGSAERLRKEIARIDKAGDWITWPGEVPDARGEMRSSWVVVVPSTEPDPFPNVVLESMAEGRAVIGTDMGGIVEMIIDGTTGRLVRPRDPQELAAAMVEILSDRETAERLGGAGSERARSAFSREVFSTRWRGLVHEHLLNGDASIARVGGTE
jgi:glycosyltransferase involved in cell wall biosynthesis